MLQLPLHRIFCEIVIIAVVPKLYWYITILMIFEHEITNKMWKKGVVTINMNIQLQCFFEKSVTCCYY